MACYYVAITGNYESFQYFKFETNFQKDESLFQKNWGTIFLVGTTETTTFSYKTALSKTKAIQKVWGG